MDGAYPYYCVNLLAITMVSITMVAITMVAVTMVTLLRHMEGLGAHSSYRFFSLGGGGGGEEGMYSVCKGRMGSSEHLLEFCRF